MRVNTHSWWRFIIPATVYTEVTSSDGGYSHTSHERWLIFEWALTRLAALEGSGGEDDLPHPDDPRTWPEL